MKKKFITCYMNNEDGVTAIEFALVSPILFLMIMGIIEFGLILFASNVVEAAVNTSARFSVTGNNYTELQIERGAAADDVLDREDFIRQEIIRVAGTLMDADGINISCTNLGDTFQNVTQRNSGNYGCGDGINNQGSCSDMGNGQEAILYTVSYCWDLFTPMIGQFFNNNQYVIRSSMVVRNENFNNQAPNNQAPQSNP